MTQTTQTSGLAAVLTLHMASLRGVLGCHALVRPRHAGPWMEGARVGHVLPERAEGAVQAFSPRAGGMVEPLTGDRAAWLAVYGWAGPSVDLTLVVTIAPMPAPDLQPLLQALEDKVGWILLAAEEAQAATGRDVALSVDLGAQVLLEAALAHSPAELADQWIARLEKALSPDAVAVVWVANDQPRLAALSGGGLIALPTAARRAIETLADAAIEARSPQIMTLDATNDAGDALDVLGAERALTLPIYAGDPCRAVVVALWARPDATLPDLAAADLIARVLGESMVIQDRARPSLMRRLRHWGEGGVRALFGRRYARLKLIGAGVSVLLLLAAVLPSQHRPAFTARIEARDRLILAAPFDGFLAEAPVQLGDLAAPGALVLRMEDSDLRLERSKAQAEQARLDNAAQAARAARDTASVRNLEAQSQQTRVQIALLDDQISRARLLADRRGLVVGGDAWRRVGGRVRLGETLLELAAPDSLAVAGFVDEDWVADIPPGATATLLLAAYPDHPIPLRLERITTETNRVDGVNTFAAWLVLTAPPDVPLMDGMRGIIRVDAGQTTWLGRYGRGLFRALARGVWQWR